MTQIVTPELPEKAKILKNFYNVVKVYWAIWVIFHLTTVFFLGFLSSDHPYSSVYFWV